MRRKRIGMGIGAGVVGLMAALAGGGPLAAEKPKEAPAAKAEEKEDPPPPKPVMRAYDIRDLVLQNRLVPPPAANPNAGLFGGNNNGAPLPSVVVPLTRAGDAIVPFRTGQMDPPNPAAPVIDFIRASHPEYWSTDAATDGGTFRELGGVLYVKAIPEAQKEVADMLALLRSTAPAPVTVIARWALCDSSEIDRYVKPLRVNGAAVRTVDVAGLEASAGRPIKYVGEVSGFVGQALHVSSGRARSMVLSVRSNVGGGPEGAVGYDPVVALVQDGVSLDLTAVIGPDGATATIAVEAVFSEWRDGEAPATNPPAPAGGAGTPEHKPANPAGGVAAPAPGAAPAPAAAPAKAAAAAGGRAPYTLDKANMQVHQMRSVATAPVGKPVLAGGLTLSPAGGAGDGKQLYLILEVVGGRK